jgi:hypothetical protein
MGTDNYFGGHVCIGAVQILAYRCTLAAALLSAIPCERVTNLDLIDADVVI